MENRAHTRRSVAAHLCTRYPRKPFFLLIALLSIAGFTAVWAAGISTGSVRAALFGAGGGSKSGQVPVDLHVSKTEAIEPSPSMAVGALETPRSRHTATVLTDGRVLIAGGDMAGSSEVYDPVTGVSAPSGSLGAARSGHTATSLADGRVLIAGGSVGGSVVATTEIYDAVSGTFSAGPSMGSSRSGHTATTLSNGNILIAGGGSDTAEIFDGSVFTAVTALMSGARADASAIRMADGRVFIAGGDGLTSAEIFNPADSTFSAVPSNTTMARSRAHLRLLPDGKIQIIGGNSDGSMEVYDPLIDEIGAYAHVVPATDPCANLINHVLRAETRAALIYAGSSAPERDRSGHTITELGDSAIVVGGTDSGGNALNAITVFQSSSATVTTDKLDYQPGQTVNITGTGYAAGETVRVMIHEDPHTEFERGFDATADASGNFSGTYLVQDYDLNMHFVLGARGLTSGKTAQTTFTDNKKISLSLAGTGGGTVTSTVTPTIGGQVNFNCTRSGGVNTGTCTDVDFDNNAVITFTASAAVGSTIGAWIVPTAPGGMSIASGCASGNTSCVVNINNTAGTITLTFNGNTNTTTTVASSANPSVFGQSVTFTATVSRSPLSGSPSPAGSVQFVVDGSNFGSPVALVSAGATTATAATSTSALSVGSHTVSATYVPTGGFNASSGSLSPNQVVNKANTTTTLSSDHANPLAWSQIFPTGTGPSSTTCAQTSHPDGAGRLIVYARTTCGGGSGEVWVLNNANGLGGSPTWSLVSSSGPSRHGQTTVYDQVSNKLILFGGCSGGCLPVNNDVWVLTNANGQGGPAVWTNLSTTGGPPAARNHAAGAYDPVSNRLIIFGGQNGSGSVLGGNSFTDVWVLSNANVTSGSHTWTLLSTSGTFPLGKYQSRAFYDPVSNRLTIAGGVRNDVAVASSAVNVLTNANGTGGTPAWTNLIAEGTPGAPAFAGWNTTQNTGANRGILAQQSTSNLYYLNNVNGLGGPTTYTQITPSGGGGATPGYGLGYDAPSARTMAWHLNGSTNTSFVLLPSSASTYGESVTFTATISPVAPGAGTPTGTVQFFAGATPIGGPQPLSGGTAAVVTSTLLVDVHNITAVYSSDANFNGSTSGILTHTVSKAATTTTVLSSPNPSTYGDSVTFTSTTLTGVSPVGEGTVSFYDGGTCASPGTLLASAAAVGSLTGQAGFSSNTLAAGSHAVIACYTGTNYSSSDGSTAHVVDKRLLTVTADDKTITYGDPDPAFTFQYGTQFVLGDDAGDIDVAPTCTVTGPHTNVNSYPIVCSGGSDNNYEFSFVNGTLEIDPATLSVNAVASSKVYGDTDPAFAFALSGFKFGENAITAAVAGSASCSRTSGESVAGSPYVITCSPGSLSAANYVFVTGTTANFTITPATLAVDAVANGKIYGDADPALAYALSGFKFGENAISAGVTGVGSCSRTSGETVAGSPYVITCVPGTLAAANYVFATGATANFNVTPATLNVNAVANTKVYGDSEPVFGFTLFGFKFSEDATSAGVTGAASCTRTAGETVAGSPYTITCAAGTLAAANYNFATGTTANFTITPATLSVNAVANSKVYGETDPAFSYALSGFKFSENPMTAGLAGSASCSRTSGETVAGSPYTITCTPGSLSAANYIFATGTTANFNITPATLSVNAVADSKEYGSADPAFQYTLAGFKFSENAGTAGVTGLASCSRTLGETVAGSPYLITCNPGTLAAANYVFATGTTANFNITAASLSVDAVADGKIYGDPDPAFGFTLSGFKFGENETTAGVTGIASCSRTAGENVAGSPYVIACAPGTLAAANYVFATGAPADFNISPATLSVNAIADSKTYGDSDPGFQYALAGFKFSENPVTALVTGFASCSRTPGESVAGSPYIITCAPGTLAAPNYVFATGTTANFVINQRPATWTTNPNSKTYGDLDPVPLTTGSGSNFVDTVSATYSRVAGESASPPTYHITAALSAAPGVLANYIITNDGAEFTINKRLATWTTNPASKTYGDPDPVPLTSGSGSNFVDAVTATYSRVGGENASPPTYHISAALSAAAGVLDNYVVTNDGAEFTINKRLATWTTNPNSKTYGDPDPAGLTTGSGSNFVGADNVTATYARAGGENASPPTYHISATLSATPLSALDNYIITNAGAEFTINKRALTITAVTNSKTYDGNTTAASTPTVSGLQFSDSVTGLTQVYDNRNAGTGKTLSVSGYTVNDGNGGNNYTVSTVDDHTGVIIQATLTLTAIANSRVYNGLTDATAIPTISGLISPDSVTGLTETYDTKHVGTGKTMSVATYTVNDGNGGLNYDVHTVQNHSGVITVAPLTITALTNTKTYDGNASAAAVPTVSGTQTGDSVTGLTQTYDTRHFGAGKTLSVATYTVNDGNGGNNYNVSTVPNNTGVINKLAITVTAVAWTKPFDGNISSGGVPTIAPPLVGSDTPNFVQTYDTQFVGTGKTLTPSGTATDGNSGLNYSYTFVPVNTGVIATIYCFNGFLSPVGGSVEGGNGGTFTDPVRAFKLNSTIPLRFTLYAAGCGGSPITTGIHTLQMVRYSTAVDADPAIDATPTDAATTGNQFRLTGTDWHFNLDTKRTPNITAGTWLVKATLLDGSVKTVWISIKK